MDECDFDVKKVKGWPVDEIVALYKAGGWWKDHYKPEGLTELIDGSFAFVVAVDGTGRAVGMGRAISDGTSDAWIQDVAVLEEMRGRGIGRALVKSLLDHCLGSGLVWVGLVAEPGTRNFYEPLGFKELPGEPMVYLREG